MTENKALTKFQSVVQNYTLTTIKYEK